MIERSYVFQTLELINEVEIVHLRTHKYTRRYPPPPKVTSLSRRFSNDDEQHRSASSIDLVEDLYSITGSQPSRSSSDTPPEQLKKKSREATQHVVGINRATDYCETSVIVFDKCRGSMYGGASGSGVRGVLVVAV